MINTKYEQAYKYGYNSKTDLYGSPTSDAYNLNNQKAGEAWVYQTYGKGCVPAADKANDKDAVTPTAGNRAQCF